MILGLSITNLRFEELDALSKHKKLEIRYQAKTTTQHYRIKSEKKQIFSYSFVNKLRMFLINYELITPTSCLIQLYVTQL